MCASERRCAFCFHANSLSSFIFLTSSSYTRDELGWLQILLKCARATPPLHRRRHLPPLFSETKQNKKNNKNTKKIQKTARGYKCKPVISLVFSPFGKAATAPRTGYLHFISIWKTSLAPSIPSLPFSAAVTQFTFHYGDGSFERLALRIVNDLQLQPCRAPRGDKK